MMFLVIRLVGVIKWRVMSLKKFYLSLKVAVNRKLQKFMHGLFILVLYIEVYTVSFAILYCRASLVLLSQQIS